MGNCIKKQTVTWRSFRVTNSLDTAQKGVLTVTDTDLIYIDSKTNNCTVWPINYLRKVWSGQ